MKKALSLFLALVMLIGLLPMNVFATEEISGIAYGDEYVYPMDTVKKLEGTITIYDNTYIIAKGYYGAVIDLENLNFNTVNITRNPDATLMGYAFLKRLPTVGQVPSYAGDYTEVIWDKAAEAELGIPDDAAYLYIYYNSNEIVYLPSSVVFKNIERVEDEEKEDVEVVGGSSITVASWNIGHFSGGGPSWKVTDAQFEKAAAVFSQYIYDELDASLITINEYSAMFTPSHAAKDALFDSYTAAQFEGEQNAYSCNALFSKWPVCNLEAHAFVCNQSVQTSPSAAIKPTDYYYVCGEINLGGQAVTVVTAHLAFNLGLTPDTICLNQIDELIETFADHERVILMGDWNTQDFAYFERFVEAGYTLGNSDSARYTYAYDHPNRSLDNIMVKGLEISNFNVHHTMLSDHYAVSATISLCTNGEDHAVHNYSSVVTAPICTERGYTTYTCTICGDTYQTPWLDPSAYEGKTLACVGDSITAGVGVTKDETDYVTLLAEQLGMDYIRLGASGTTLCTEGSRTCNIGQLTEARLQGADVVTIAMGINDFCAAAEGYYELGDIDSTDSSTIYGAVRMWCEQIEELRKTESLAETQFYFATPVITSWNNSVTSSRDWDQSKTNIHGYTLRDLCNAILEVAALYDVPAIDLNLISGMYYISTEQNNVTEFGGDGVHPGEGGHAMMANALADALLQNDLRDDHEHVYASCIATKYPSCQPGEAACVCGVCSNVKVKELEAISEHEYTETTTAPTCTEQGYTTHTCPCGDRYVDGYTEPTGHSFGEWVEVTTPTCDAEGQDKRECAACGDVQYRDTRISGDPNKILVSNPVSEDYFEGKIIMAIGDSLTAGTGVTAEERYHYITAQALGMTNINSGTSGAVLCPGGHLPNKFETLMTAEILTKRNVDVVTIFLGVNDWDNGVVNGTYQGKPKYDENQTYYDLGQFGTDDTTTIYGAAKMWCERIIELQETEGCEHIQFVFITPVITSYNKSVTYQKDWNQDKVNVFGYTLRQYCTAIMEVCTYYGVPVLDQNIYSGMYYHSEDDNNVDYFGGDGIHPGPNGHAMMADALTEFLMEGYSYEERTVADCGHIYESAVTAPTCTEDGYTTYRCPECHYSYVDSYTDPTGEHSYTAGVCVWCGRSKLGSEWLAPDFAEGDYTMIAIPDTQNLVTYWPETYYDLCRWISDNKDALNIQAVLHMGDMVNNNNDTEWTICEAGTDIINAAGIPWMPMRGNHDDSVWFNRYYDYSTYGTEQRWFGGSYEDDKLDHTYWFVTAGDREYMILSLGWAPSWDVLAWAQGVVEANSDKRVILVDHAYMNKDGTLLSKGDPHCVSSFLSGYPDGDDVWAAFENYGNVVLAMGGHIHSADVVTYLDQNGAGRDVTSLLIDRQNDDIQSRLGMVAVFTFHADSDVVDINWYSTRYDALYRAKNQFSITVPDVCEHNYTSAIVEPTCTEGGGTKYTCTTCDHSYVEEDSEPLGHNCETITITPTCTTQGYTADVCSVCGQEERKVFSYDITNRFKWNEGYVISATHGGMSSDKNWVASDYVDISAFSSIEIVTGDTITAGTTLGIAFYDANKKYISGIRHTDQQGNEYGILVHDLMLPDNAVYVRTTWYSVNHEKYDGATLHTFYCKGYSIEIPALGHSFENNTCTTCGLERVDMTERFTDWTQGGPVLYRNGYGYGEEGYPDGSNPNLKYSDYVCVEGMDTLELTVCARTGSSATGGYAFYTDKGVEHFISEGASTRNGNGASAEGTIVHTITVPENAKYIRVSYWVDSTGYAAAVPFNCVGYADHLHTYIPTVTVPTCTEQGYTTYTCSACGDSYVDSYVDALGHEYSAGLCTICGDDTVTASLEGNTLTLTGAVAESTQILVACYDGDGQFVDSIRLIWQKNSITEVIPTGDTIRLFFVDKNWSPLRQFIPLSR